MTSKSIDYLREHTKEFTDNNFVLNNIKLVIFYVKKYQNREDYDDIVSAGIQGLINLYRKHGAANNTTLKLNYIKKHVIIYLSEMGNIYRVPIKAFEKMEYIKSEKSEYKDIFESNNDEDQLSDIYKDESKKILNEAIKKLPKNQKSIILEIYKNDLSAHKIGKKRGVSYQNICVIRKKALEKLKKSCKELGNT